MVEPPRRQLDPVIRQAVHRGQRRHVSLAGRLPKENNIHDDDQERIERLSGDEQQVLVPTRIGHPSRHTTERDVAGFEHLGVELHLDVQLQEGGVGRLRLGVQWDGKSKSNAWMTASDENGKRCPTAIVLGLLGGQGRRS